MQLDDDVSLIISQGGSVGGNQAHLAPEVLNAVKPLILPTTRQVVVSYAKQIVFETGVMLCELAVLKHAIPGYPSGRTGPPPASKIEYDDSVICPWLSGGE
jgi:hypothetical protein